MNNVMRSKNIIKIVVISLICLMNSSCHSNKYDYDLNQALKLADKNRAELEKVFKHYENDSLKLEAVKFLIRNMTGSFSKHEQIVDICQPFYEEYDSLTSLCEYEMNAEIGKKIDSLWNQFLYMNHQLRNLPYQLDLENTSAEQLIAEIDLTFKSWQENVYTKNFSFEDFCEYILPYRRMNGLIIDDARTNFYERHKGKYFTHPGKDMIEEVDSLLYEYHHLKHSQFWGTQIPILTASTFEHLQNGLCEHRCWYNSLLLSALGMAVAVDFVPAWGNRNNNHTWNILIKDGKSYAFEAFWDVDRWKYKRIYNNKTFDVDWGRFRLAKVYRHSFKNYIEGPIKDKRVNSENIPAFFRDFKKKDVSHEYFDTENITVDLQNIPKDTHYAYLCVWNFQEWQPVQWGKIENNKAVFEGMGKDIVYLPCYYENGSLIHAGKPFLLNKTGDIETFSTNLDNKEYLYIKHYAGAPLHYGNKWNNISVSRTIITGSKTSLFDKSDTLCIFPDSIEIYGDKLNSLSDQPVRYLRVSLPYQKIAFSDLSFYYKDNRYIEKKITGVQLLHNLDSTENGENAVYMFDEYKSTGYKKELKDEFIEIDLGKEYVISSINFTPYFEAGLKDDLEYELFYWNKGWQFLKKQMGSKKHVIIKDVPKNALFILKHPDRNNRPGARPFIYRGNEVLWY